MNGMQARRAVLDNNGGTFEYVEGEGWTRDPYLTGYYVAQEDHETTIPLSGFDAGSMRRFRERLIDQGFLVELVGAWVSDRYGSDATVTLDSVMRIRDLSVAKELGRANHQHAIWDIANGCEIEVGAHV